MNKRAQVGLIDASEIPSWLLYPLVVIIMLVLIGSLFVMGASVYCMLSNKCMIPFGFIGMWRWGIPWIGFERHTYTNVEAHNYTTNNCFVNNVKVNCSEIGYGN